MTRKNERFLFYDSIDDVQYTERMILYATEANLQLLREQPEWFVDGTFAVCPVIFSQLYTVHVLLPEGKSVPVVYALLASKSGSTYNRMLNKISEALNGFHPQVVHIDFEISMILEIETVFPSAGILACSFHFNQSVWRHIQGDRLLLRKCSDPDFFLKLRMFAALQFVPEHDVRSMFDLLLSSQFVQDHHYLLTTFINYFESTWIGRP